MLKLLFVLMMLAFSLTSFAEECASNISELKTLMGNNSFPTDWMEKDEHPYRLRFKDSNEGLVVLITGAKGEIAKMTAEICTKGNNYVANIHNIVWGAAAPSVIKGKSVDSLKLKLPYQSVMKISVSFMTLEFNPTK
jgi:hypothetical protein